MGHAHGQGAVAMTLSVVQAGRLRAESLMTDVFTVRRVTGNDVDPLTGVDVPRSVVVYEGRGKLQSYEGYEQTAEVVAHSMTIQRMSVHFPVGDYHPQVGDVVTCVDSVDKNLVGYEFRVTQDVPFKTHATAYRAFVDYKAD